MGEPRKNMLSPPLPPLPRLLSDRPRLVSLNSWDELYGMLLSSEDVGGNIIDVESNTAV